MRRIPKQARSRAKVDAIVAAAAEHVMTVGYEGLSTVEVAKAAGVSVGSLYQFFDNKDDLMQAIAEQHVEKLQSFRTELFGPDAIYVPVEILIGRNVDWLVAHNAKHPTFNHIFSGAWSDVQLLDTLNETMDGIVQGLAVIIRHHAPNLPEHRVQAGAGVLIYITKGMLGLLESAEPGTHPLLIAEVKRLATVYFEDLVSGSES